MTTNVELHHPALHCAAGSDWATLWQILREPEAPKPSEAGVNAFAVATPSLAAYGIDRKLARTMEKQAQLCLVGAASALRAWSPMQPAGDTQALAHTGLYLGLPSIDEEVPPLAALKRRDAGRGAGGEDSWLSIMLSETPPFSGLSLLNSSACAHISASFGLRGALAAFSPACDAGLQALVEGVLSVAEGENRHALIGAVSPKLHPLLPVQLAHAGWLPEHGCAPGEASAFVIASAADPSQPQPGPTLRLAGHARGFVPPPPAPQPTSRAELARLFDQALTAAGRQPRDIGWVLPAACLAAPAGDCLSQALADFFGAASDALPVGRVERAIGLLGPAEPLVHLGLAHTALCSGARLVWNCARAGHDEQALGGPTVMLVAWAPQGQCVVVLLERGAS